jgi:hypothetical protein
VPVAAGPLSRLLGRAHREAQAAFRRIDVNALRTIVVRIHRAVVDAGVEQGHLDGFPRRGHKVQLDVAVRGGPACGHAPDQRRFELAQALHPAQRVLALLAKLCDVRRAAEQRVIVGERRFDFAAPRSAVRSATSVVVALRLASVQSAILFGDELRTACAIRAGLALPVRTGRGRRGGRETRVPSMSHRAFPAEPRTTVPGFLPGAAAAAGVRAAVAPAGRKSA